MLNLKRKATRIIENKKKKSSIGEHKNLKKKKKYSSENVETEEKDEKK